MRRRTLLLAAFARAVVVDVLEDVLEDSLACIYRTSRV
jgi:hypothetical protein